MVPIPRLPVEGLNVSPVVVTPSPVVDPVPVTYGINCAWFVVFVDIDTPPLIPVSLEPSP